MKLDFYKGNSANLPEIGEKNSIYLTDDTHQLYISDDDGVLHEVNLDDVPRWKKFIGQTPNT